MKIKRFLKLLFFSVYIILIIFLSQNSIAAEIKVWVFDMDSGEGVLSSIQLSFKSQEPILVDQTGECGFLRFTYDCQLLDRIHADPVDECYYSTDELCKKLVILKVGRRANRIPCVKSKRFLLVEFEDGTKKHYAVSWKGYPKIGKPKRISPLPRSTGLNPRKKVPIDLYIERTIKKLSLPLNSVDNKNELEKDNLAKIIIPSYSKIEPFRNILCFGLECQGELKRYSRNIEKRIDWIIKVDRNTIKRKFEKKDAVYRYQIKTCDEMKIAKDKF